MHRPFRDSIDFPANPFVALADFVLMVVVIVTLGYLSQTVFSKTVQERNAVDLMKKQIIEDLERTEQPSEQRKALASAYKAKQIVIPANGNDGDLLRLSFEGASLYTAPKSRGSQTNLSAYGKEVFSGFGQLLSQYQLRQERPGEGLFKRISVQGNCDPNEADPNQLNSKQPTGENVDMLWGISQDEAREVIDLLTKDNENKQIPRELKLDRSVLEATGRGPWDTSVTLDSAGKKIGLRKHRVDIVIFFAGKQAVNHIKLAKSNTAGGS